MPTLVATAVVRPYRTHETAAKNGGRLVWARLRDGRHRETVKKTAYTCRLCGAIHNGIMLAPPLDEFGRPQVCHDCYEMKIALKEYVGRAPRGWRTQRWKDWNDRASLYAVARLYIQEYEKARKDGRL